MVKALIHEGTVLGVTSCYGESVVTVNSIKTVYKDVANHLRIKRRLQKSARVSHYTRNGVVIYRFVSRRGRILYEFRVLLVGEDVLMEPITQLRHG